MKRRRHLRGSLRLEKPVTWVVRYPDEQGRELRMFVGTVDQYPNTRVGKELARAAADRLMMAVNPNLRMGSRSIKLGDSSPKKADGFAAIYETDRIALMKPTAAKSARSLMNRYIVPILGHLYLEEITGRWPQVLVNGMQAQKCSNKTISNALTILSRMTKLAKQYEYPCVVFARWMIKMPPAQVKTPERCFTVDEAVQIIAAADIPWKVLFALHAHCGFRRGEGLGFVWPNINFSDRVIHVRQAAVLGVIDTVKSARSRADIPMSDYLYDLLQEYRERWVPNDLGLLFANQQGYPINGDYINNQVLKPLLKRLGIPRGGLHAFRHGHTTNLLRAGVPINVTRDLDRHADIKTTIDYAHTVMADHREAQDRISNVFSAGETRRKAAQLSLENTEKVT